MSEQGEASAPIAGMHQGSPSRSAAVILAAAVFGLTVGAAVRSFAWYPLRITSNSMFPTVAAGDWVVVSPRRAGTEVPVERGDIVLFTFPFGGDGRAIKRVVAVAGDEVRTAGPDAVLANGAIACIPRSTAARSASFPGPRCWARSQPCSGGRGSGAPARSFVHEHDYRAVVARDGGPRFFRRDGQLVPVADGAAAADPVHAQ